MAAVPELAVPEQALHPSQSWDYFTTNVYFDLEEHGKSLGLEGQDDSDVSRRLMDEPKTFTYEGDGLPSLPDDDGEADLRVLLHHYSIEGCDGRFWTEKLLRRILTKEHVEAELKASRTLSVLDIQGYLDKILVPPSNERPEAYLRIFALLVLTSRASDIGKFITENVCDEKLPLVLNLESPNRSLSLREARGKALECVQGWDWDQIQRFSHTQWRLIFPFLGVSEDKIPDAIVLEPEIVRPWRNSSTESNMGMFQHVTCVEIHPTAHSFNNVLSKVSQRETRFFSMLWLTPPAQEMP